MNAAEAGQEHRATQINTSELGGHGDERGDNYVEESDILFHDSIHICFI
jgi:hypothetical protein